MRENEDAVAIYSRKSRFTGKGESIGNQVELAKEYGDEGDYQFVNGILGAIVRELPNAEAAASQE